MMGKQIFSPTLNQLQVPLLNASSKSIDLVIIGTKGRTGLKRLLLGSVAHGIVQHAHCPVLLVR